MLRRTFIKGAAACGAGLLVPMQAGAVQVLGGNAFGSYWRIVLGRDVGTTLVSQRVEGIVAAIDASMSPYRMDTEISLLNAADTTDWLPLSDGLSTVVQAALQVSARTGGAFDPTVGAIVGRYGFGPIKGARVGDASGLALKDGALRKVDRRMTLDLCGIAKGWALDRMVTELSALGLTDFLMELGGEVAARGRHPDGRAWRVAVDDPTGTTALALQLDGRAVATSGDAPQGYTIGAQKYGHIINPASGAAATGDLASVSVFAPEAMQADALATALFAMGSERAGALAQGLGLDVLMLLHDGGGIRVQAFGDAEGLML